jgi:uncharacterized repeat protein (TIGR03803 family)
MDKTDKAVSLAMIPKVQFVVAVALLLVATQIAGAQTESVLYNFCSQTYCSDGAAPVGGLVMDKKGNLYGTTQQGGANRLGTVFKLNSSGVETVLHSFNGTTDGFYPYDTLILDKKGNLYGTAFYSGANQGGTVFEVSPSGVETVLYNFPAFDGDGSDPYSGLIMDKEGNLHGTTEFGGAYIEGTVFELSANGTETALYSFNSGNGTDGLYPYGTPIMDAQGNLYGTTSGGGAYTYGTVFKVNPTGVETVLHSFNFDGTDGVWPYAGLVRDKKGNLYGTTSGGGAYNGGTVFKLSKKGIETVLYRFNPHNGTDGNTPNGPLVMDKSGNLYGTTANGGNCYNCGTVFMVTPTGTETILHSFTQNGSDGYQPSAGLVMDKAGNLYGTTEYGGTQGQGAIFRVTP